MLDACQTVADSRSRDRAVVLSSDDQPCAVFPCMHIAQDPAFAKHSSARLHYRILSHLLPFGVVCVSLAEFVRISDSVSPGKSPAPVMRRALGILSYCRRATLDPTHVHSPSMRLAQ